MAYRVSHGRTQITCHDLFSSCSQSRDATNPQARQSFTLNNQTKLLLTKAAWKAGTHSRPSWCRFLHADIATAHDKRAKNDAEKTNNNDKRETAGVLKHVLVICSKQYKPWRFNQGRQFTSINSNYEIYVQVKRKCWLWGRSVVTSVPSAKWRHHF